MRGTIRAVLVVLVAGTAFSLYRARQDQATLAVTSTPTTPNSALTPASVSQAESPAAESPTVETPLPESPPISPPPPTPTTATGVPCLPTPVVAPAPAPPQPLSGRLGLWVAVVDPQTLQPIRAVATNADGVFPLASTYKQAVLWALLREFDAGRLQPTERFNVTPSNQSLGDYPFDGSNVRTLSQRMIQFSDNTATDILHRRVGLNRVQSVADGLGLCQTRVMMPTKDWWVMEAGLSPTFKARPDWWESGAERLKLAAQIDEESRKQRYDALQRQLDRYFEQRHTPEDDLQVHNLSTPYEWATFVTHSFLRPGLSPRAQKWQREVMATGFGRSALKAQMAGNVDYFGGKGGNGWQLLTYSGYFQTKDGQRVVYAFMQHGANETYTMPNTRYAFAWINAGIDAVLGEQKPKPKAPVKLLPQATPADKAKADAVRGAQPPQPQPQRPLPTPPPQP